MSPLAAFATGAAFALANVAHCAGMCGVFALRAAQLPGRVGGFFAYGLGKAFTYGFLGTAAAWIGAEVLSTGGPAQIVAAIAVAFILIIAAVARFLPPRTRAAGGGTLARFLAPGLAAAGRSDSWGGRFTLGALTAALPCGVVYLAALQAAAAGSAASALSLMAGFGLGTLPALAAIAFVGQRVFARVPAARMRVASGCLMLLVGLFALGRAIAPLLAGAGPRSCCH
jgi:sulfite exporter TauE/SafE